MFSLQIDGGSTPFTDGTFATLHVLIYFVLSPIVLCFPSPIRAGIKVHSIFRSDRLTILTLLPVPNHLGQRFENVCLSCTELAEDFAHYSP
ncbi:unnamed protein product [Cylicocyclus nassatus]|uniref:Uncharacterized protein n=1 Tax=Cylicocyclus nassatus TaxID=53992 RepID=A0AA36DMX9_CYLNA|nr:unnamed protein product [Cylicocyclus nassatus]